MSGRAGRRGIDDRGIVMLMMSEQLPASAGKSLLKVGGAICHGNSSLVVWRQLSWICSLGDDCLRCKPIVPPPPPHRVRQTGSTRLST